MRAGIGNSQRHPASPFHLSPTTIPGPQDATVGPKHNLPPNWNHKGTNFHVSRIQMPITGKRGGVFCCHPAQSVLMCALVNKPAGAHSIDLGQFRSRRKMEISGKSSGDRGGYQLGVGGGFVRPHAPASSQIAWGGENVWRCPCFQKIPPWCLCMTGEYFTFYSGSAPAVPRCSTLPPTLA